MIRTIKKVLPGQPGTKKLLAKYGKRFLCLRYRQDTARNKKLKTIEIIINEKDNVVHNKIPANKVMHLRIDFGEQYTASLVKQAGGKWNKNKRYWELPYQQVQALGLEKRILNKNV